MKFFMSKMIIFDLDDTLIDTKKRHFNIISDFLQHFFAEKKLISFSEYLILRKKNCFSNFDVINFLRNEKIEKKFFENYFLQRIEQENDLKTDSEIVNFDFLKNLKQKNIKLMVLSLRSNIENAIKQVKNFQFSTFIDDFIFLKHSDNPKTKVLSEIKGKNEILFYAGDSVIDYEAAIQNNISFFGVKTGFYEYDFSIYSDINEVLLKFF